MDWLKYLAMPTNKYLTAKEIGMAPATLIAMGKKGLVDVRDTSPKTYCRVNSIAAKVYYMCEKHKNEYENYFIIYKSNRAYGMLCSIIGGTICDCWGKPFPLTDCISIQFGQKKYCLITGKEIV